MKKKKLLYLICMIVALFAVTLIFSACSMLSKFEDDGSDTQNGAPQDSTITYTWYDADGELLYEEEVEKNSKPSDHPLPPDTDQWDYIEWQKGSTKTEKIAYRIPQNSYFVGNVFQIVVQDLGEQPLATGSAFVFNNDGWFITNAHVMEDAYYAQAIFNIPNPTTGESYTYLSINSGTYYHLDKDIYIGKIENYYKVRSYYKDIPINLHYEVGEKTYSIGYPHSSAELIIEEGAVTTSWSDLYEKLYSGNSYICSSSYIAPGSSGGILTNANLEVIGITTLAWIDENDGFISGAAISAFNFNNLLKNTDEGNLVSLIERFHQEEQVFIGFFNNMKDLESSGETEKFYFDDGSFAYIEKWGNEGSSHVVSGSLSAFTDGFIYYEEECYWSSGDRRIASFYGYYDHKNGFANFTYEFQYEWNDGNYYTVECSDINYSPTVSLTLNRCVCDHPYYFTPNESNITYAKETFNSIYESLTGYLEQFK